MEQKLLNYKTTCCKQFSETENCAVSIAYLKKCIREHLSLDEAYCILISCIQNSDITETIIMVECVQGTGMKIFKSSKSAMEISIEEIPDILSTPYKEKLAALCLVN